MRVRLIDFGLCLSYLNKQGEHHDEESGFGFRGNIEYASIYVCQENLPSRRDDLISLAYMLVYLLKNQCFSKSISENDVLEV